MKKIHFYQAPLDICRFCSILIKNIKEMKTYSKYENNQEFCWFDSSNIIFSKCYDNPGELKVVKIIFKNGRTYLYKDVDVNDYIKFRDAESNGSVFSKTIKNYAATRIQDTDLDKLEEMRQKFIESNQEIQETKVSELGYVIEYCDETGEFVLKIGENVIYSAVEGNVSIINLFKSMGINCTLREVDKIENKTDENEDKINVD